MTVLTTLTRDDLGSMLARYGVWQFDASPTSGGVENTNYFVTAYATPGQAHLQPRQLVLTLLESAVDDSTWRLPALLDTLSGAGLPTPVLLRTVDGEASSTWSGRRVLLCTRMPGEHRARVSAADCASIGRFLARMHGATAARLAHTPAHPRDLSWLRAHVSSLSPALPPWQRDLLTEGLRRVEALLARPEFARLPEAVVHGDLFRDNALFNDAGLSGVIDFHHAARHKRLFDIAVTLCDWCIDPTTGVCDQRARSLLDAYDAIAPITDAEHALLPLFMCYATLAFTLSRLQGHVDRPDGYGKSPIPMLHRLSQCIAPPWPVLAFRGVQRDPAGLPTTAVP